MALRLPPVARVCALTLLLTALALGAPLALSRAQQPDAGAEDALAIGSVSINCTAGYATHVLDKTLNVVKYDGYALPVANSELARNWADQGGLKWQAAYNYSVLPLRVDILQRGAGGLQGRIEVESSYPYAQGESSRAASAIISRDFNVPPSVAQSYFFAPRVCPPSQPGAAVGVTVRIYQGSMKKAQWIIQPEATQLEPSHVYTLLLDGPPQEIDGDPINAGNHLELQLREQHPPGLVYDGFSVTRFDNYLIPCERSMLCGLPLAARDFAFACADLGAVRQWPQPDQQALLAFMLGGGHLCLYNCGPGSWQGLSLSDAVAGGPLAQAVGRGVLLPTAGGLAAGRTAMQAYLEGELQEFVLWTGGSVHGKSLQIPPALTAGRSSGLLRLYKGRELPSRQPGYLNPIWAYREMFTAAALEPWDFPEFNLPLTPQNVPGADSLNSIVLANRNWAEMKAAESAYLPAPLDLQSRPATPLPLALLAGSLLCLAGLWPLPARLRRVQVTLFVAATLWLGGQLLLSHPAVAEPVTLRIEDADPRFSVRATRILCARAMRARGRITVKLPADALVRHVRGRQPGSWALDATESGGISVDCQGYASVTADSWEAQPPEAGTGLPVKVVAKRLDAGRTELRLDTSALPSGQGCWLMTPMGLQYVPAGVEDYRLELAIPRLPVIPGYDRLSAWSQAFQQVADQRQFSTRLLGAPWDAQLRALTLFPESCGTHDPLERLAWGGLLQLPMGMRGALGQQAVLFFELPPDTGAPVGRSLRFARLCVPLEGRP